MKKGTWSAFAVFLVLSSDTVAADTVICSSHTAFCQTPTHEDKPVDSKPCRAFELVFLDVLIVRS